MSLDETLVQDQLAHDADHAALRAEAAGRGVTIAALTAGVSTLADHANVHQALHTNHNLIGAATTLPTSGLTGSGHLAHHEALHKAYNLRIGSVPGAPTNVAALPDNTSAVICFTPPKITDGGTTPPTAGSLGSNALAAITSYTATSSPGGFTGSGTSGELTVSGLTNGVAYTFTVTATNAAGTGAASAASNSVTPNARITITAPTNGTDASGAINTAISGAASGRAVYLPAGTYTLTTSNLATKANVRFFGAGDTTILTGAKGVYMPTDSSIDHVKITCGTGNNIALNNTSSSSTGARVENCTFRGPGPFFGIWLNGSGTNRPSGWTLRKLDIADYDRGMHFRPADNILIDQCTIVQADQTQGVLFWGGSGNTISNSVIDGGITGIAWLHFRATLKTYADRGVSFNNTVFRNTITDISEEGISVDVIGNLASEVAALDNGNITSKGNGTNQIVFSGGTWGTAGTTDYVNYYACWMTGTNRGKTAKITAQSAGTMTLDTTNINYAAVTVGDRVALGAPFIGNVFEQNHVTLKTGSGTVSLLLYGMAYGNTIKNNYGTGSPAHTQVGTGTVLGIDKAISARAINSLLLSDINHSGNSGVAPTGYNTIDNNRADSWDIAADLLDYDFNLNSGNEFLNYGDSLTRNVITTSGAVRADFHVMATTGNVGDPGVAILNTAPGGTVLTHQT